MDSTGDLNKAERMRPLGDKSGDVIQTAVETESCKLWNSLKYMDDGDNKKNPHVSLVRAQKKAREREWARSNLWDLGWEFSRIAERQCKFEKTHQIPGGISRNPQGPSYWYLYQKGNADLKISQLAVEQRLTSTKPNQTNQTKKQKSPQNADGWVLRRKNGVWNTVECCFQ